MHKRLAENPSRTILSVKYKNRTKKGLSVEFEIILRNEYMNLSKQDLVKGKQDIG
jgi:hypothetical protein